jgi:hypothetical protein
MLDYTYLMGKVRVPLIARENLKLQMYPQGPLQPPYSKPGIHTPINRQFKSHLIAEGLLIWNYIILRIVKLKFQQNNL